MNIAPGARPIQRRRRDKIHLRIDARISVTCVRMMDQRRTPGSARRPFRQNESNAPDILTVSLEEDPDRRSHPVGRPRRAISGAGKMHTERLSPRDRLLLRRLHFHR